MADLGNICNKTRRYAVKLEDVIIFIANNIVKKVDKHLKLLEKHI
ncbi:hypothetical protein [Ruminococcus flavefaciens]|nr:hypothetical protein [Ruminococcus flavefaciens]